MEWTLLNQDQYLTTRWSGGTTTQLAIAPAEAVYADRDFLWRLSSARVEQEHSHFTPLPGYGRLLSALDGSLELKIGEERELSLAPYQVCAFDGGTPVESWGQCTDFNLMVRKGVCEGAVQSLSLSPESTLVVTTALPATAEMPCTMMALYCAVGAVTLPEAHMTVRAGQLLLCQNSAPAPMRLASSEQATLMMVSVRSQ